MKVGPNKILGLAVGERSILIAEVSQVDGRREVSRAGEFVYPEGVALGQPEAIGTALGEFLKTSGYTAKSAVLGIPAKWVLTKSKDLPPVDPSLAADMLRLQVESEFSAELKDLVYDYAGQTDAAQTSHVLLAATPKRHVDQALAISEGAHLDLRGIAPTAVVLSARTGNGAGETLVLSITPSGTELAAQRGMQPSLLRHVGSSVAVTATVAGEVRRASHMLPRNGAAVGNGAVNGHSHGQVVVWDDAGLDVAARRAVTDALGPSARAGEFESLGAGSLPAGMPAQAAAAALAVAGMTANGLAIDFLHPRLAAPKPPRVSRQVILGVAAGIVLVIGIIWAYVDLSSRESYRNQLLMDNKKVESDVMNAKTEVAKIKFAEQWRNGDPRYLACLAELTNAIPASSRRAVFLYGLTLDDKMKGDIRGRAVDQAAANAFYKNLNGNKKRFSGIVSDLDKGNNNPDTKAQFRCSFTITFTYVPG